MAQLNHKEAEQALIDGKYIKNVYYSDGEYIFMKNGQITTEEGYPCGGFYSEFWSVYQSKLPENWTIIDKPESNLI